LILQPFEEHLPPTHYASIVSNVHRQMKN
jgi:hypothetical protein